MKVDQALAMLLDGPSDSPEVHHVLRAAGLLRLGSGTGPMWVLTEEGLARLERLR